VLLLESAAHQVVLVLSQLVAVELSFVMSLDLRDTVICYPHPYRFLLLFSASVFLLQICQLAVVEHYFLQALHRPLRRCYSVLDSAGAVVRGRTAQQVFWPFLGLEALP
jgi:hypothetical protein